MRVVTLTNTQPRSLLYFLSLKRKKAMPARRFAKDGASAPGQRWLGLSSRQYPRAYYLGPDARRINLWSVNHPVRVPISSSR